MRINRTDDVKRQLTTDARGNWPFRSSACTFVPGSEKSIETTFAPVELSFRGTFAPGEQKVQELTLHGTFAPLELSLPRSECSKNFRSMELSHPWNVRSTNNFRAL